MPCSRSRSVWQKDHLANIFPALVRLVPPDPLQSWKRDVANSGTGDRPVIPTNIVWPKHFLCLSLLLISPANMTQHCQITSAYLQGVMTNCVFTLLNKLFRALAGEGSASHGHSLKERAYVCSLQCLWNAQSHRRDSSRNPGGYCYDKQLDSG